MDVAFFILACGAVVGLLGLYYRAQGLQAKAMDRLLDLIGEQNRERESLISRLQFPDRVPRRTTGQSQVHPSISPERRQALASVGKVEPQTDGDA